MSKGWQNFFRDQLGAAAFYGPILAAGFIVDWLYGAHDARTVVASAMFGGVWAFVSMAWKEELLRRREADKRRARGER